MWVVYIAILFFYFCIRPVLFKNNYICDLSTLLWGFCALLAATGFLGIRQTGVEVNLMVIVYIIMFWVGTLSVRKNKISTILRETEKYTYKPRFHLLMVVLFCAWIISLYFLPKALSVIDQYGYAGLRYYAFSASDIYMNVVQLLFFQVFIEPIYMATNIIFITLSVFWNKPSYFIIIVINTVLYSILFGGRSIVVVVIQTIIFALFLKEKGNIKRIFINNKGKALFAITTIGVLLYLVSLRKFSMLSPINTILMYFVGPFSFFDLLYTRDLFTDKLLYGSALFGFVTTPFAYIIRAVFDPTFRPAQAVINAITQEYYYIGGGVNFNALTTVLYPAICDFSYLGIVIYPFIIGYITRKIERLYFAKNDLRTLSFYLYCFGSVLSSTMNYSWMNMASGVTILAITLSFKKESSI